MIPTYPIKRGLALLSFLFLGTASSFSAVILDTGVIALKSTDPLQAGRTLINGFPSDWSGAKAFPGYVATTSLFNRETFTLPVTPFPYIQISVDDPFAGVFVSAYLNAVVPNPNAPNGGLDVNYLGDNGAAGNAAGNPLFFQVVVPNNSVNRLVVAVNGFGAPVGLPFRILVEGFYDTAYNDTNPVVPEPATVGSFAAGLSLCCGAAAAKRKAARRSRVGLLA